MTEKRITLRLWLHRQEGDAWLVSRSGVGAGEWLPVSQITIPDDAIGDLAGPVDVDLPEWLAQKKNLIAGAPGEQQRGLFDAS